MSKKKKKKNQQNNQNEQVNNLKKELKNEVKEENKKIDNDVKKDLVQEEKNVEPKKEENQDVPKIALKSEEVSQKSIEELREEAIEKENKLRKIDVDSKKQDDGESSHEDAEKEEKQEKQEEKSEEKPEEKQEEKEQKTQEIKTVKEEKKEDGDEKKTKEVKTVEQNEEKSLVKKPEDKALDYIEDKTKKKKRGGVVLLVIILLLLLAVGLSTGFAIFNLSNTNILSKVTIKNIDVSNLSQNTAKNNLKETLESQLNVKYKLQYKDYEKEIAPKDIEFSYKVDEAAIDAYNYGRQGNIIENNYLIIKALIMGTEIDIKYTYNEELLAKIIDDISTSIPGVVQNPSYYIEGDGLYIDKGKDGISVPKEELKALIINTIFEREKTNYEEQVLTIPTKDTKAEKIDMFKVATEVQCEPKDAYYETEPDFKIYKEVNGIHLAISIDEANKLCSDDANGTKGEDGVLTFRIPLTLTQAAKTINDIGLEAFPYEISTFTTRFDATNYSRTNNLQIATDKIDGTVLMPGEEFSFNEVVGKRTIEEGYQDAKIYENGRVVDGLAGGICQVSSTLYNAALLGNLEVTERSNHSFTTSYLPAGRDATVVYGVKDLKFVNTRNYPVKIDGGLEAGILRFTIYGIKEEEELDIRIYANVVDTIPGKTETKVDYSLAPGQVVYEQKGHSGCRSVTTMKKYLNGELVYDEVISSDTYNQMTTIKRVGPGGDE